MRLSNRFFLQSIALATQHKNVWVVDDPVDDRHRHVVVMEELAPTGEVLVGGQDDRAVLVQVVNQLEEVIAPLPGHGQITQLTNDR